LKELFIETDYSHNTEKSREINLGKNRTMLKYILLWFPMLVIAIINGTLRDLWYKKYLGDLTAHQVSTFTLILFFALFIGFVFQKFPPSSSVQAILIGVVWVVMTLAFEFGFGRWRGNSWEKLFEDYNLLKGRLWVLIPIWITVAPYVFYRWMK
jgi:hypothetical protein